MDYTAGFLENREKDIAILKNEDFELIRSIGHSMKGFGSGYGFDLISLIGKDLEQAAKNKDLNQIESSLDSLEDYMKKIVVVFE